jgi:lysophospholipase L1-like esterase
MCKNYKVFNYFFGVFVIKNAKFAFILVLALLGACGGGGGASTEASAVATTAPAVTAVTPPAPVAADPPKIDVPVGPVVYKKISIEMYGDSSLDGFNLNFADMGKESPCQLMQSAVNAKYGAGEISVTCQTPASDSTNLVSGQFYKGGAWPLPLTYDQTAMTYTKPIPDLVLINHNLNDIRNQRVLSEYKARMELLVTKAHTAGVKVVVLENSVPLTLQTPYGATPAILATQPAFLQASKDVATAFSLPFVDTYGTTKVLQNWETYITDSIHPNAVLYKLISDNRFATIVPSIEKLRQP